VDKIGEQVLKEREKEKLINNLGFKLWWNKENR